NCLIREDAAPTFGDVAELPQRGKVSDRLRRNRNGLAPEGRGLSPVRLHFLLPSSRPASAELIETKLPWSSRVVSYRSLVRPESLLSSSRTTADSSLKPLVTDPMIRRFPSRMNSLSNDMIFLPLLFYQFLPTNR